MFGHWRYLHEQAFGPPYVPDISDRDGRSAILMGIDALEDYANAGVEGFQMDGAGFFNQEAEDAIQAATEFFSAASDSILADEGLT